MKKTFDQLEYATWQTLLTAASNTSVDTMEWTMAHLLNNPEILKKARVKIENVVGQQRLIDESDVYQLHFLKLIIKGYSKDALSSPIVPAP